MRADAVAVDLVGDVGELVIDQAPDDLSILQNERDIKAAHFEYSLRSRRLALGVAKAGVEEARIVHAILSPWRRVCKTRVGRARGAGRREGARPPRTGSPRRLQLHRHRSRRHSVLRDSRRALMAE